MLKSIIAAGLMAVSGISTADVIGNAYCYGEYIGMTIITDEGAQVIGSPGAILQNEHLRDLALGIDVDDGLLDIEMCQQEEGRGKNI